MQTVMLVEDNPANLEVTARFLERGGFNVLTPSSGDEALSLASTSELNLVIMDLDLQLWDVPDDGLRLTEQLKTLPEMNDVPIVALTGLGYDKDKARAQAAGCSEFFVKPIEDFLGFVQQMKSIANGP